MPILAGLQSFATITTITTIFLQRVCARARKAIFFLKNLVFHPQNSAIKNFLFKNTILKQNKAFFLIKHIIPQKNKVFKFYIP
jgi:hypothetical protein